MCEWSSNLAIAPSSRVFCTFSTSSKYFFYLASFSSALCSGLLVSSKIVPDGATLLPVSSFIFLKKFPCLCCVGSSSISFIIFFSHFSLSSFTAFLTFLQQLVYSLCLTTLVHSSYHLPKVAWCFSSIIFSVSSDIHLLLTCLFLCRC